MDNSRNKQELSVPREYSSQFITMSNSLLRAREKTNLLESKIEVLAIHYMDKDIKVKDKTDANGKEYSINYVEIPASRIKKLMGRDDGNTYSEIKKAAIALKQKLYIIEDTANRQFVLKSMYGDVAYDNGRLLIEFNPEMEPLFLNLKQNFTKLSLPIMFSFRKNGGFQLYKLLKSYAFSPNLPEIDMSLSQEELPSFMLTYSLTELRMLLGYVDISQPGLKKEAEKKHPDFEKMSKEEHKPTYKRWNDFTRNVLDPGIEEINEISDIYIKEIKKDTRGRGGRIVGVCVYIQHNRAYYERKKQENKETVSSPFTEEQIEDVMELAHGLFDLKLREYRDVVLKAECDFERIKAVYELYTETGSQGELYPFLMDNMDKITLPVSDISQEDKDAFIDWAADIIPVRLRLKEYKILCEAANYSRDRILKAVNVLNTTPSDVDNVMGFLLAAINKGWGIPKKKKRKNANFTERNEDWNAIFKNIAKNN